MIPALTWIPRGASKARPARYEIGPDEYELIKKLAAEEKKRSTNNVENDGVDEDHQATGETFKVRNDGDESDPELPAELKMGEYDLDDPGVDINVDEDMNDMYEVMPHGDTALALDVESEDDDAEDDEIRPNDAVIIVATTEDEYSRLEIQVLTEEGTLFVHHDITLKDFPLCLAWMDIPPFLVNNEQKEVGSYVAVGTFDPAIEIWNLDILDPLEPIAVLGGEDKSISAKKGKKGKKSPPMLAGSHTQAVMSLAWNSTYRQTIASGSADFTIKIWDVTTQQCSHSFTNHQDKVQSVQWNPSEAWSLASGSFDKTLMVTDCRSMSQTILISNLPADVESMKWNPFQPNHLYCSLEDGQVTCVDVRRPGSPLATFQAHTKTCSCLSFSKIVPGMLATSSVDKTVRVWDVSSVGSAVAPQLVAYKSMNVGKLFTVEYYPSDHFTLAAGGDGGVVAVWESDEQEAIKAHFSSRIPGAVAAEEAESVAVGMQEMELASAEDVAVASRVVVLQEKNTYGLVHGTSNLADEDAEPDDGEDEKTPAEKDKKKKKKKKKHFPSK